MFFIVVAGLLFLGVSSILSGLLAIGFGLARGVKAVVAPILLPLVFFGLAALLLWVNPVDGEYRVAIWYLPPGLLGPFIGAYDLYRLFKRRQEAREEAERAVQRPSFDLSRIQLPPMD
jgi:hypothetical protein